MQTSVDIGITPVICAIDSHLDSVDISITEGNVAQTSVDVGITKE